MRNYVDYQGVCSLICLPGIFKRERNISVAISLHTCMCVIYVICCLSGLHEFYSYICWKKWHGFDCSFIEDFVKFLFKAHWLNTSILANRISKENENTT